MVHGLNLFLVITWAFFEDFKAKHGLYMKHFLKKKKTIQQVCVKFINRSLGFSFMKKEKNK